MPTLSRSDITVYREVVGTEWCEARHVGVAISGRVGVLLRDGTTGELGPDDVFEIPPGHDAWTIGSESAVVIEWTGFRAWSTPTHGVHERVLTTLLFTDYSGHLLMDNRNALLVDAELTIVSFAKG